MASEISYKLVYFNVRTLGEPIRFLLRYMHLPFEDFRVDVHTWEQVKHSYKWHQLPELHVTRGCGSSEEENFCITQTRAICRFLATSHPHFNLIPDDALEKARCDEMVDVVDDMRQRMKPYIVTKFFGNEKDKEQLPSLKMDLYQNQNFQLHLKNLEKMLENFRKMGKSGDFILGDKLSWADFFLANFTQIWEQVLEEVEDDKLLGTCPLLKKQQLAVNNIQEIKEWIETRPKTSC